MGFGYADWNDVFYPPGTKSSEYLEHYARHFNSVELDTTFYATPDVGRVKHWASAVPGDFKFAMKTPRTVTHDGSIDRNVDRMFEFLDAVFHFDQKLGVILLQFGPSFDATQSPKLRTFLRALPSDMRFAAEFRHSSWFADATAALLAEHNIAWVAGDYAAPPRPPRLTADFLYIRWIGEHHRFKQLNHEQIDVTDRLLWWRAQLTSPTARQLTSIWGYFNNDYSGYAIAACKRFKELLGLSTAARENPKQPTLFG